MMIFEKFCSKVLLPQSILIKREVLNDYEFCNLVRVYLRKYPDYSLVKVQDSFAICESIKIQKKGGRKKK